TAANSRATPCRPGSRCRTPEHCQRCAAERIRVAYAPGDGSRGEAVGSDAAGRAGRDRQEGRRRPDRGELADGEPVARDAGGVAGEHDAAPAIAAGSTGPAASVAAGPVRAAPAIAAW